MSVKKECIYLMFCKAEKGAVIYFNYIKKAKRCN